MGLEIEGVHFAYADRPVLRDVSATLPEGRFYGILGPNGSGKTTLLDLMAGLSAPDAGVIRYKGQPLRAYSRKAVSREMALVPQNFYINFPFTAKAAVMMGRYPHIPRFQSPSAEDLEIVETVMERTGTDRLADRYVSELSGGERQRVVFARALAQDTPVLILDEATSNLDVRHGFQLLNLAAERVREEGRTVIAVFQDINLAALYCDHLIFLRDGRILVDGPADEALTPETVAAVFDVPARVFHEPFSDSRHVAFRRGAV